MQESASALPTTLATCSVTHTQQTMLLHSVDSAALDSLILCGYCAQKRVQQNREASTRGRADGERAGGKVAMRRSAAARSASGRRKAAARSASS